MSEGLTAYVWPMEFTSRLGRLEVKDLPDASRKIWADLWLPSIKMAAGMENEERGDSDPVQVWAGN